MAAIDTTGKIGMATAITALTSLTAPILAGQSQSGTTCELCFHE